jgi:hypothetical protein
VRKRVEFRVQAPPDDAHIRKYANAEASRKTRGGVGVVKLDAWLDEDLDARLRSYCATSRRRKTAVVEEALRRLLHELGA